MSELESYLEEHILPDAKSVIAHIDKQYRVCYSVSGVTDQLHRLGFSCKKPTHVPRKQDHAQQCEDFFRKQKEYLPELQMLLSENFHIQVARKQ